MTPLPLRATAFAILPLLSAACSSPPSRLYLLSSQATPQQSEMAARDGTRPASYGSSAPASDGGRIVGVAVTLPEYLDRLDIVERTGANEVKPDYSAQWGESLAMTASRAVSEDLTALVPGVDVVMLPSRSRRSFDYRVNLDLTKFESDSAGNCVLAGRWSISDDDGTERASGRVTRSERNDGPGYDAMAAAMSRNLAAVSADIAKAMRGLPATPVQNGATPVRKPPARPAR
jgi:uncharacterized protein